MEAKGHLRVSITDQHTPVALVLQHWEGLLLTNPHVLYGLRSLFRQLQPHDALGKSLLVLLQLHQGPQGI